MKAALRTALLLAACGFSSGGWAVSPAASVPRTLAVQPLGRVEPAMLEHLSSGLERVFAASVLVLPPREHPREAWYEPRRRWRGGDLLELLDGPLGGPDDRRVLVTSADISTTKPPYDDWGVFGLCPIGGRTAVVSTYRLRQASADLLYERLVRVSAHELGHAFGLDHCPREGCLMADAKGTIRSVDRGADFCESCRGALGGRLSPR